MLNVILLRAVMIGVIALYMGITALSIMTSVEQNIKHDIKHDTQYKGRVLLC
jgi:hypothetical protein